MSFMEDFLLGCAGTDGFYPVSIPYSCRFDSARSCYLTRTPSVSGGTTKFTFSAWVKLAAILSDNRIFGAGSGGTREGFRVQGAGYFEFVLAGGTDANVVFDPIIRDPSSHLHVLLSVDTTQAAAANRVRLWLNGTQLAATGATYPSLNYAMSRINASGVAQEIGTTASAAFSNMYLSEVYFIDGVALTPSTFGQFSAQNPTVWVPKTPTGLTYGTNGFHLAFGNAAALGTDTSGNGNNWTSSGLTSSDQMQDTPTNNYCTLNGVFTPLGSLVKATYAEGNLKHIGSTGGYADSEGTFAIPTTGKWYFEAKYLDANKGFVGIHAFIGTIEYGYMYRGSSGVLYRYDGTTDQSTGVTVTTNDIVSVAIDADAGTITWRKNNVQIGNSVSLSSWGGRSWFPFCEDDSSGAASNILFNFGANGFAYTPPTGFKALCSANLPDPAVVNSGKYADAQLWTGTGSALNITSFNFQPDLVWGKSRSIASSHELYDSVRGATKALSSDWTGAEVTDSTKLTAFLSNGFSLGTSGSLNTNGSTQVGWCWKKDAKAGLDIVGYAGTGVAHTIPHGLGVAPEMILTKNLTDSYGWQVYHKFANATPQNYYLMLQSTNAAVSESSAWNNTAPTASLFTVGTSGLANHVDHNFVAYLFASVEGFSKIGSFTGNGNADGPFVYCGFRPRWVLIKNISRASTDWFIYDAVRPGYNPINICLIADASTQEFSGGALNIFDLVSNGFKIRGTDTAINQNGDTFIYAAFAAAPMKYANAA